MNLPKFDTPLSGWGWGWVSQDTSDKPAPNPSQEGNLKKDLMVFSFLEIA